MTNITLKQLRYVDALARHGHFGQAAEASAISQPALSMQIKELEASLGLRLFERSARQVRPTAFGEAFVVRTREILRSVDELQELATTARDGVMGRLRLGVIPTIAPYLLPALIGGLAQKYPGLDLHVRETLTEKLIAELKDGRLDAAIVALPVSESSLKEVALFDETFVLVRPRADADKPVPDPDALREMRLLLLEEGHCFRNQALSFCDIRASLPAEGLEGSSLSTLVQMVSAGIGVTLIPQMAVPVETRSADVDVAKFSGVQPRRTIGMIWRNSSVMGAQLTEVSDLVRQTATAPAN